MGHQPETDATPLSRDLAAALGRDLSGEVRVDAYTRSLYAGDASMYAIEPAAVTFPRDDGDVQAVVTAAAEFDVPVLARGAGTSLAGQTVGPGVVMDFSRHMNRILDVDLESRTAVVQPGVVQDDLNRAAAGVGLMFGPDTSTSNRATLGGMIGNNSAGSGSMRYGMTIDHVQALDTVLSDASRARLLPVTEAERALRARGDSLEARLYRELPDLVTGHAGAIAKHYPKFWRRAGGYRLDRLLDKPFDLAKFVVGSEGTLLTVTEALVGLVPKPANRVIAVGHFADVAGAIAATEDALACEPHQVELMDSTILELSRQRVEYRALGTMLEGEPAALLFVTFHGDTEAEALAGMDRLTALWRRHGHGYHVLRAVDPGVQAEVLKVRKAGLGMLMAASVGARRPLAFVEDTAVDPAVLPEYVKRFRGVLDRHGLTAGLYGHCSVGCLHIRPFLDLTQPGQVATMRAVAEEIRDLVAEYGGANSSEHGDGLARSEFNRSIFGDELYEAMRTVKRLFDPAGRMNPGKIVDAPPMTAHLRDVALPAARPIRTRLDFEVVGGMRGAADRCMNIGQCRKTTTGVMCPSYMATREEEHSTRGRANALVKALSTPDPHAALGDERLHEILDLCLECKACKSECPLGVDMASLKSEFLAHYQSIHGIPLRAKLFAGIRGLNRLGAAFAPVSNLPGRFGPARGLAERYLGVTRHRPLPRFARQTLIRWHRGRRAASNPAPRGEVVFLADSFTTFTEPAIGRAAIELLELAGWSVRLHNSGCCGRASISKGLLDQATGLAAKMTADLAPHVRRGARIVGCEPSCVLSLKEEHLSLQPDNADARLVAEHTALVEDLLLEAIDDGGLRLREDSPVSGRRIVFHGHCHQKALVGTGTTVGLLRRIPGAEVVELDAGCCGMAGSFGFEAEHYDLSMRVGGLRLFPAVNAEPAGTLVAATGVSCRQQIAQGTRRQAVHPLELVRQAVAPS
ncbi:FAD-binding and (Fe-S)-binding domain-containing protein [Amycolatopsis sp. NPDC059027]|uniref:FAD-binding and (Fe-S)-binding domain-containing protein n=1 Tax=Amycolatopsis sp. NPDC059027 TaxID=3346709 RepID=UPI00366C5B9B